MTTDTEQSPPTKRGRGWLVLLVPVLAIGSCVGVRHLQAQKALDAQQVAAEQAFSPVIEAMTTAAQASDEPVDLDKTVRVIHGLDQALTDSDDLLDYLEVLRRQDYRGVDPRVIEARTDILEVLLQVYAKQVEMEDQQAMWDATSGALAVFSVVGVAVDASTDTELIAGAIPAGGLSADGSLSVDRDQAAKLVQQRLDLAEERDALHQDLLALQADLLAVSFEHSEVWFEVLEDWDRLCLMRDRAWLAAAESDWVNAEAAAREAVAVAPDETEAHLLLAWALMEQGSPEKLDESAVLLDTYIDEHPDRSAPALLLRGRLNASRGDDDAARLDLEQAAAMYPKQSGLLADMLDPYRMRGYLRQSREGNTVLRGYRSSMLGAGAFSPDLYLAAEAFHSGDTDKGQARILDHFSRRRTSKQWDFVLEDIDACMDLLGDDYLSLFPESGWLDLRTDPTLLGSSLALEVDNRSDRALHNATLVLVLQFTDMHPLDYETMTAPETLPLVDANERTSFGKLEIAQPLLGEIKGVDDIVQTRAILVTNEAVFWVDTDDYRVAEVLNARRRNQRVDPVARVALGQAQCRWDESMLGDTLHIDVPLDLSLVGAIWRVQGDKETPPKTNSVSDGYIHLSFAGVDVEQGANVLVRTPVDQIELRCEGDGSPLIIE